MKIPIEVENRRTDNTMAKRKRTDNTMAKSKTTLIDKTLHRKLMIRKTNPLRNRKVNSCAPKSANSSCYISGTRPVNVKRHEHEMSKFKCLLIKTYRHTL
jgi:hypothetical protein